MEARFARKKRTSWTGENVHLTETGDADAPHLMVEVTTTTATLPDGAVVGDGHEPLEKHDLFPGQHLVDTGDVAAKILARSASTALTSISLGRSCPMYPGKRANKKASITDMFRWIDKGAESAARRVR